MTVIGEKVGGLVWPKDLAVDHSGFIGEKIDIAIIVRDRLPFFGIGRKG